MARINEKVVNNVAGNSKFVTSFRNIGIRHGFSLGSRNHSYLIKSTTTTTTKGRVTSPLTIAVNEKTIRSRQREWNSEATRALAPVSGRADVRNWADDSPGGCPSLRRCRLRSSAKQTRRSRDRSRSRRSHLTRRSLRWVNCLLSYQIHAQWVPECWVSFIIEEIVIFANWRRHVYIRISLKSQ